MPSSSGHTAVNIAARLQSLRSAPSHPGGWADVQARLAARSAADARRVFAGRFAAAASIALIAVTAAWRIGDLVHEQPRELARELTPLTAEQALALDRVAQLRAQSAALEELLAAIGDRPALQRAGTSVPIDSLEAQVQWVDHQISVGQDQIEPDSAERLWRQRVGAMNSLVRLRYVEAQRIDL